jgi:hypothetical protein
LPGRASIAIEINAENIRQSPQEIHHVKPHTGFWFGDDTCFSIDMIPLTGNVPDSSTNRLVMPEG